MSSDHFSPWSERQGESGFAWSFLGAALQATELPFGVVNAPGQRYHPAIIAQAAASLCELFPGRLWVALGSGEASNEHITGARWPSKRDRNARLRECVDVMRALFAGEVVDHDGLVRVDRALGRGWGGRPRHDQPAARGAPARDRCVSRGRRRRQADPPAGPPQLGGGRGRGAADRARPVAHQRVRPAAVVGPRDGRAVRRGGGPRAPRGRAGGGARVGGHGTARGLAQRAGGAWLRTDPPAPRRAGSRPIHRRVRRARPAGAPRVSRKATSDVWWKNAVFYCLDVETFLDDDGDGCGDFSGLCERIDYLTGLGIGCVWLMPFMPSCQRDDGYDITDFYGIDPRLGTHGDLLDVVRTAGEGGIRVIADLVVNHTSNEHPWFKDARRGRDSPFHDFYVWRDEKPEEKPGDIVFPDQENSNWAFDEEAGRWYMHRFYSHQPDLNVANAEVRDEIAQTVGFWLQQGLSGFRVDAVPFLIEPPGTDERTRQDPHELLRDLRRFMGRRRGEAVLLGEVKLAPPQQREFFGDEDGDELQVVLSFTVNQAMFLALAREDATPIARALEALPPIPEDCQWANFVRNHDELTLDKLSGDERQEVFAAFGPEKEVQLYGRGLRRRLPTMVDGDERRIRLAYSLAFSLPGTPVLFYGEEIGMAENLAIEGRYSVRAPMQWSADPQAG